jgi:hypothetical protein
MLGQSGFQPVVMFTVGLGGLESEKGGKLTTLIPLCFDASRRKAGE